MFKTIKSGKAAVITDQIERITADGMLLESGATLEADIIITATGLDVLLLGGAEFSIDGEPVNIAETWSYKGMMFSGVPNLVYTLGYINASWTLRSELVAEYVCRLVNRMDELNVSQCTPRLREQDENMNLRHLVEDFSPVISGAPCTCFRYRRIAIPGGIRKTTPMIRRSSVTRRLRTGF